MNKLIFELIQLQNGNRGLLWTEEDKEEFAELIVRECAKLADESTSRPFQSYGIMIKEHFGVEEWTKNF